MFAKALELSLYSSIYFTQFMNLPHVPYSVVILIPAKNEVNTVATVVTEVKRRIAATVVVIDDASSDDTAQTARAAGALVLSLPYSLGAWGAIQTGLRFALKHQFEVAITMDADGQHEANAIPALLTPICQHQCDVVIGAYPQRGSPLRQWAWSFFRKLSGISLEDLTSGLRAYNQAAIRLLASSAATLLDYQDLGVLLLLHQHQLRIQETPIVMYPRLQGHSRIFSSWWAVSQYMLYTSLLCLARINVQPKITCHTKSLLPF
ncbi:MAG: glycosyltransferase family 2 protein [Pseudomonadota bacterium]|nr:glycosyltransferase family 2 protein [Pseudomonadota bacterium]